MVAYLNIYLVGWCIMKNKFTKQGFTLIELLAAIIIILVIIVIAVPLITNIKEIVKREAFRATAYSIADAGRLLIANENESQGYQEFYYLDSKEYNADGWKLDYSGTGPRTGVVVLNERSKVAMAIHNGTYCAIKSTDTNKVTVTKTAPDDCNAYSIIETCDTWEQIAIKYDVSLADLLTANNETDSNSSTCGRNVKIPVTSTSSGSSYAGGDGGSKVYYKTYYTMGYVSTSVTLPYSYEYTIKLGVLPLNIANIEVTRVTTQSVFESLDDFKRYITKRNMGEVIWPGETPVEIDISQASVFRDHAARNANMTADDVSVMCDTEACYATVSATLDNITNVNPNTIEGVGQVVYSPIKFTVEFNGAGESCAVRTSADAEPGTLAGAGTSADPYLVESIEDLVALSNNVNAGNTYSGKYISITNSFDFKNNKSYENSGTTIYGDINGNGTIEGLKTELTSGAGFIPIGNNTNRFRGRLLGNAECIYNLYINRPTTAYVGLIGATAGGTVTALTLTDINIIGGDYTAGVAGYTENGYITDISITGNVTGNNYVGMATGKFYSDGGSYKVSSIIAEGNVTGANGVGGLVGYVYMRYSGGSLTGIYKGGSISSTGANVGRIVGLNESWVDGSIRISALGMSSTTINGSTISSASNTSNHGATLTDIYELNNINLVDGPLDTYIGGDNDGNGYYWDYDATGKIVRKSVIDNSLTFSLSGSGTTDDPYLIYNYDDLRMATLNLSSTYKLMSNIDLSNARFYMLGSYMNIFRGKFNGNEKTISNLKIDSPHAAYIGFSGFNKGTITALMLDDIYINANNYTGGVTGYNENGHIADISITGNITGNNYVGMAVGRFYSDGGSYKVTSVITQGNVTGTSQVGGIVGGVYMRYRGGSISGINKGGNITASGSNVGRVLGLNDSWVDGSIKLSALGMSSTTINGSTVSSTYNTSNHGSDIGNISEVNNINLSEIALDTYIGGDNDGNGYYWDYNDAGTIVRKSVIDYPLTFNLSGGGSNEDPYLIYNYDDLRMATLNLSSTYKLMSNIDLSNDRFYMLGSYMNIFRGKFNGNEKTISNLKIDSPHAAYIGFSGFNKGTITALMLDDIYINANNYTGGVTGYNENGHIADISITGNITGNNYVGMAVGRFYSDGGSYKVTSIITEGNVTGTSQVGGIVGGVYMRYSGGSLTGINKGGSVTANGSNVGRVLGLNDNWVDGSIKLSALAMSSTTINGSTVASTYSTSNHGASITNLSELNNINLAEVVLDTYIGGDNDGNGYYWDYNDAGTIVRKSVIDYPLTFNLSGGGSNEDPYLIYNYDDLRMATLNLSSTYKLMSNIDLSNDRFYMLGSYMNIFRGKFNGNEKTISNLKIDSPHAAYIGFSGFNKGTITALMLDDIYINANNYTGGVTGYNENGHIADISITGNITGNNYVGMAVGRFYSDGGSYKVSSIITEGNVMGTSQVGGIVGGVYMRYSGGSITGINKGGSIYATGSNVGRILGLNDNWVDGSIKLSALAMSSTTINGSTVSSTYNTSNHGASITSLSELNNINLAEIALDTYIGGDNDGNGYYWDYNAAGTIVRKSVIDYPLTFNLSGGGSNEDPYLVNDYDSLKQIPLKLGSVYKLTADIELSGERFYMLGSYMNYFTGKLYGNNMTIHNLTINSPHVSYVGLVGFNNCGTVTGLNLNNANITAGNYTGALAGYNNNGYIIDNIVKGDITGNNYVGLAVGRFYSNGGSYKVGNIVAEGNVDGNDGVGGLVGGVYMRYRGGSLTGIFSGGSITSNSTNIGRILGINDHWVDGSIVINASATTSTTLNGSRVVCLSGEEQIPCTNPASRNGSDITSSDLSYSSTYTDRGFNFSDETQDYIWYIDGGTAKLREGSL